MAITTATNVIYGPTQKEVELAAKTLGEIIRAKNLENLEERITLWDNGCDENLHRYGKLTVWERLIVNRHGLRLESGYCKGRQDDGTCEDGPHRLREIWPSEDTVRKYKLYSNPERLKDILEKLK